MNRKIVIFVALRIEWNHYVIISAVDNEFFIYFFCGTDIRNLDIMFYTGPSVQLFWFSFIKLNSPLGKHSKIIHKVRDCHVYNGFLFIDKFNFSTKILNICEEFQWFWYILYCQKINLENWHDNFKMYCKCKILLRPLPCCSLYDTVRWVS